MRKMWVVLAVLAAVPAFAQQDKAKKPPVQHVIFGDGSDIEAGRDHPAVILIDPRTKATFSNLIKIRGDFNDKLMASVYEL